MLTRFLTNYFAAIVMAAASGAAFVAVSMGFTVAAFAIAMAAPIAISLKEHKASIRQSSWKLYLSSEKGAMANTGAFVAIITGVLVLVFGLILSGPVLDQAATSGSNANIPSFSGARSLNDLVPFVYYGVIVLVGVGLMSLGGIRVYKGD